VRSLIGGGWSLIMLNERENILSALREKPLKVYEIMKRVNISNEEAGQSLLPKMRDDGLIKFEFTKEDGSSDEPPLACAASSLPCSNLGFWDATIPD
jgi:hypothetical protein